MWLEHLSVEAVIEIASVVIFSGQDGEMESSHYPISREQQLWQEKSQTLPAEEALA